MSTEIIEGKVRDVTPDTEPPEERALVIPAAPVQGHLAVGVGALASMSDEAFERNLVMLTKGVERSKRVKQAIMKQDEDYGLIPGTKNPTLLKPGAEKLALAYGLVGRFTHAIKYGHAEDEPPITVVVDCYLHLGSTDGPVVAQGMGMASSWEKRYRWRKGMRTCPECGNGGIVWVKSRDNYWHPRDAKPDGGCDRNFPAGDVRIEGQELGDVENPDPFELGNTLLKMGEKRAYVDAVLRATASSGLFTQDMDADEGDGHAGTGVGGGPSPSGTPPPASTPSRPAPTPARAPEPAPAPSGEDLQIVVAEQPDSGVRRVRDAHAEKRWEGERAKLEIIGKIGNRKHTAIVLGPLAEAAVDANIQIGDVVRFVGAEVEEIVWAPDKPTKKEIWGAAPSYLMTDVLIGDGGGWISLANTVPSSVPVASPPPAATTAPEMPETTAPARKAGTPGEYMTTSMVLTRPVERTMRGQTPVAIVVGLADDGEIIRAGLSIDIDGQLGPVEDPFVTEGDRVNVYGEWKPGGWLVIDTIGKPA